MQTKQRRKKTSKTISPEVKAILGQFSRSVANVFIKLRKAKGYTSYESFAFSNDFPRAQYWRVENGRGNLTFLTVSKLLAIHNMTMTDFLQRVNEERKAEEKHFNSGGSEN